MSGIDVSSSTPNSWDDVYRAHIALTYLDSEQYAALQNLLDPPPAQRLIREKPRSAREWWRRVPASS